MNIGLFYRGVLILFTLLGVSVTGLAQADEPVRLKTTLVEVPVTVRFPGGRYVVDLKKEDFQIHENGVQRPVEFFGSREIPFSAVLLIDSSGSTQAQLELIKKSAMVFIEELRPQDKAMVVSFHDSVQVLCGMTGNREELRRAVRSIGPGEYTQVYEAVYRVVWELLEKVEGRKGVVLFTDGIDTASTEISSEDTLDAVVDSEEVMIFPVRYNTRASVEAKLSARAKSRANEAAASHVNVIGNLDKVYREGFAYLNEVASLSGGELYEVDDLSTLDGTFSKIANELRNQYLIGFYPGEGGPSERKLRVNVRREGVQVRARPRIIVEND